MLNDFLIIYEINKGISLINLATQNAYIPIFPEGIP